MQTTVIVLGMHRSGTSCLAGIMENAGIDFGEVSTRNPYNPRGNRENSKIMGLHDSLLGYNNGSWDMPPAVITWPEHLRAERDKIIREFQYAHLWGFKDPRALLMLDGWLEALQRVVFVGTYRHPLSVARSLQERNQFPLEKSLRLWKIYNDKLLSYSDKYCFPVISFDLPAEAYIGKVDSVLDSLALKPGPEALVFFEDALRNPLRVSGEMPDDVAELYHKLNQRQHK